MQNIWRFETTQRIQQAIASMKAFALEVDGKFGYLFRGRVPFTVTFVPASYLDAGDNGLVTLREAEYLLSGWPQKNSCFNRQRVYSRRLFPDLNYPILSLDEDAASFVKRATLAHAYRAKPAANLAT